MTDSNEQTEIEAKAAVSGSRQEPFVMLPCPFCKTKVHLHAGHQGMNFITCGQRDDGSDGCGAIVSFRPDLRGNAARSAFNRRAT